MKTFTLFLSFILLFQCNLFSAAEPTETYLVFFTDKDPSDWKATDFDKKAIQRRTDLGIAFPAWEDLPVNEHYTQEVAEVAEELKHPLRWFNAVSVKATPSQVYEIEKLPFVTKVQALVESPSAIAAWENPLTTYRKAPDTTKNRKLLALQREQLGFELMEAAGLSGKGTRIAVFDAGFTGADEHIAFEHLRKNKQIKLTKDFVGRGKVYKGSGHGTAVLGCIAGKVNGIRIGMAVDAEFLLARTELALREPKSEEDNWLAAMEWADREGADIISSSLGYSKSRYTYADMTGEKTLVTKAAAMAVRKGILVVNSAGNEGTGKFHYIAAPGDADSVLTIGASYPMMAYKMPFSSFGPNYRGILKPEISAPGYVLSAHKKGGFRPTAGTSFSCPLIAGIAACMIQKYPNASNMEIRQKLIEAASRYPYADYSLGYGVFSAERAFGDQVEKEVAPSFEIDVVRDTIWFTIEPNALAKDSAKYTSGKPFSYRFVKKTGKIVGARTVLLRQGVKRFGLPVKSCPSGKLEAWFEGYYSH